MSTCFHNFKMTHVLVQYTEDSVLHVVILKNIKLTASGLCLAKYSDGKYYEAKILKYGGLSELKSCRLTLLKKQIKQSPLKDVKHSVSRQKLESSRRQLLSGDTHVLIKYTEDDVLQVVKIENIQLTATTLCLAKYYDGKFYEATILKYGRLAELKTYKLQLLKEHPPLIKVKKQATFYKKLEHSKRQLFVAGTETESIEEITHENDAKPVAEISHENEGEQVGEISHERDFENESEPVLPISHEGDLEYDAEPVADISHEIEAEPVAEISHESEAEPVSQISHEIEAEPVAEISHEDGYEYEAAYPSVVMPSKSASKRYFCIYCKKTYVKLPRHLTQMHKYEYDVKQIISLPRDSDQRKKLLDKIRMKGIFEFNTNSKFNNGQLIVTRRPNAKKMRGPDHYIPCKYCKNFYSKITIYRHYRKCAFSTRKDYEYNSRQIQIYGRKLIRRVHKRANHIMRDKICPILQPGTVSETVRFDELIILFGNKLTCKYRQPHLMYHIRQILRTLARFLLTIRTINPEIKELKSLFEPRHYDSLLTAVHKLARLNTRTNEYEVPSIATRLGNYIKKCGNLLISECIKTSDLKMKNSVENFLKLHNEDYSTYVNKTAVETQIRVKRNKPIELPLHEDVKLLYEYLDMNTKKLCVLLRDSFSYNVWTKLSKCVLVSIQLFNRKRAGEIERLLISDFSKRQSIDRGKHDDLYNSLSKLEQILTERFVKVELRGKLGRSVPILLSNQQIETINLILKHRENAGVSEDNLYVFGCRGGSNSFFRACIALRYFAEQCGAKRPENLRGTKLRKQIATVVQILNLQERELGQLANFMGHDLKIHADHYRLPSTALQIGQLSKLLIMMEDGDINRYKGKTLEEINVLGNRSQNYVYNNATPEKLQDDNIIINTTPTKSTKRIEDSSRGNTVINTTPKKSRKRLSNVSPLGKIKRITWTTPEKQAARNSFRTHLEDGYLPTGKECAEIIKAESALRNRTVNQLKAWVNNQLKKHKS